MTRFGTHGLVHDGLRFELVPRKYVRRRLREYVRSGLARPWVVEVGHTAVLQCEAAGSPPPRVVWVRDMLPVEISNPRYTILEAGKSLFVSIVTYF